MVLISSATAETLKEIDTKAVTSFNEASTFQQAAQLFTKTYYDAFQPSISLIRVFATMPFGALPDFYKQNVSALAKAKNVANLLQDTTPVLSLMGTSGAKPDWNDPRKSQGHVGIPLVSSEFISAIPMMARLFQSMRGDLAWLDQKDVDAVKKTMGNLSGLFYVADAASDLDSKGRKIIAAQDFVAANQIKTVFAVGSGFITGGVFMVLVCFTRETLDAKVTELFSLPVSRFKSATTAAVSRKAIFQ